MQVCNVKKLILTAVIVTGGLQILSSQSMEMPAMPSMPSAPQIQMPTISNTTSAPSFYRPSVPTQQAQNKGTESTPSNMPAAKTETVISDGKTSTELYSNLLKNNSMLTALDISSLYDSGLFTDISSLNSTSLSGYQTATNTNFLLQQILTSLDELKKQQKEASPAEKTELQNTQADSQTFKTRDPSILRFKINGYNVIDSLTTVFMSETEPDGSFLLTADRKYYAGSKPFLETFYFLFRTVKSNGQTVTYQVQPTIIQDTKNENSYMYRLSSVKTLTAEKTGNLVVLRYVGDGLDTDLLLNLGQK